MRALIVDDDSHIRQLVHATIADPDDTVLEAADGNTAWELLQRYQFDVAILDIEMPGRNGMELTRTIKQDPALAGTVVILLTAESSPAAIAAARAAGAQEYLVKPFSPLQLLQMLECVRGERRP